MDHRLTWIAIVGALLANGVLLMSAAVTARSFSSWHLRAPIFDFEQPSS
jgi:hypothetical protein